MDRETRKRIEDFFEGFELVDFLQIPVDEVFDAFEVQIEENLDEIEEFIGVRERRTASEEGDS
jgi:hypothetical protein